MSEASTKVRVLRKSLDAKECQRVLRSVADIEEGLAGESDGKSAFRSCNVCQFSRWYGPSSS